MVAHKGGDRRNWRTTLECICSLSLLLGTQNFSLSRARTYTHTKNFLIPFWGPTKFDMLLNLDSLSGGRG
jgi:hypothetical protein